jgi:peptide chain release factor 3
LKFSSPNAFAEKKRNCDISYPGDIVGLHVMEILKLRYAGEGEIMSFKGILAFLRTF